MKLDMKSFKKVREDARSAVLEHPNGHQIHIAKESLSPALKEQLSTLPLHRVDGGDQETSGKDLINYGPLVAAENMQNAPYTTEDMKNVTAQSQVPSIDYSQPITVANSPQTLASSIAMPVQGSHNYAAPEAAQSQPVQQTESAPQSGPQNYKIPQSQAPASIDPLKMMPHQGLEGATKEMIAGSQAAAKAAGIAGIAQAKAAEEKQAKIQQIEENFNIDKKFLTEQMRSAVHDMNNNHINPNHYVENMSVPGKVATAIGMLLGGMGAGLTGGPNPAMQFLQSQIERDVESQKNNINRKHTIFQANLQMLGNAQDAANFSKAVVAEKYATDVEKAGFASKNPTQMAQAQQYAGEIRAKYEPAINQMAMTRSLLAGHGNNNTATGYTPEQKVSFGIIDPKDREEAKKELALATENEKLRADMLDSFQHLKNSFLRGAFSPSDRQSAITAFAGRLAKIAEGKFNMEESKSQAEAILPSKGDFSDATLANKEKRLNQLFDTLQAGHTTLKSYNIVVPRGGAAKENTKVTQGYKNYARNNK